MKSTLILTLFLLTFQQGEPLARTWLVRQDGSGDFSVIQDAVDAADEGDVIDVGPGRYTEYSTNNVGYGDFDVHVYIGANNLTILGAGPNETIVGPYHIDDLENPSNGIGNIGEFDLVVRGIGFVNLSSSGFLHYSGFLDAGFCSFENVGNGIKGSFPRGADIQNCTFGGISGMGIHCLQSNSVEVLSSTFNSCWLGVFLDGCSGFSISNCGFSGGGTPVQINSSQWGNLNTCSMSDFSFAGVAFYNNGHVEMRDNVIESGLSEYGIWFSTLGNLNASNNIISTNSNVLFFVYAAIEDFHFNFNHLFRGDGSFVLTEEQHPWEYHVDLTHNYWGTTDLEEISEHIWDGNDFPNSNLIIDFEPIADGPVSTEQLTLDAIKALYR